MPVRERPSRGFASHFWLRGGRFVALRTALTPDPIVAVVGIAPPADNREDVVGDRQQRELLEDAARVRVDWRRRTVRLELVGRVDTARERAVGKDLRLELLCRADRRAAHVGVRVAGQHVAIALERPQRRVVNLRAALARCACLAHAERRAVIVVGRLVVLARLVRQPVALEVVEDAANVAALARAAAAAIDQNLGRQDRLGIRALVRNLEAVVERRQRTERPAGATVLNVRGQWAIRHEGGCEWEDVRGEATGALAGRVLCARPLGVRSRCSRMLEAFHEQGRCARGGCGRGGGSARGGVAAGAAGESHLRDVLVAALGEEVCAIDIAPVPIGWEVRHGEKLVCTRAGDLLAAQFRATVPLGLGGLGRRQHGG
eukprot:7383834-Prymnesium_polylepis.1